MPVTHSLNDNVFQHKLRFKFSCWYVPQVSVFTSDAIFGVYLTRNTMVRHLEPTSAELRNTSSSFKLGLTKPHQNRMRLIVVDKTKGFNNNAYRTAHITCITGVLLINFFVFIVNPSIICRPTCTPIQMTLTFKFMSGSYIFYCIYE